MTPTDQPAAESVPAQILHAAAGVAKLATPAAGERVYVRNHLSWARRDGTPCVVVAPTPNRAVEVRNTLSKRVRVYAITAMLVDGLGVAAEGLDWRAEWAARVAELLAATLSVGVGAGEDYFAQVDSAEPGDSAAAEQAGLFRAAGSVTLTHRRPHRTGV